MTKLEKDFEKFDRENPAFWELFHNFAFNLVDAGYKRLSASLIVERIRWETTVQSFEDYKISNNHRAYYARKFNGMYPDAPYSFTIRPLKKAKKKISRKRFVDPSQSTFNF